MPDQIEIVDEVRSVSRPAVEPVEFPLPVVPDWDELVKQGNHVARLIDRHLDYEERGRRLLPNERLMPIGLCPEQRVNMNTDILAVTGS